MFTLPHLLLTSAALAALSACSSMGGVSHVQRVATQGGVAPAKACDAAAAGQKEIVKYQADCIVWTAA